MDKKLENLNDDDLRIVLYILNYNPTERINYYNLDRQILEKLEKDNIISISTWKDRYGVTYSTLKINPEIEDKLKAFLKKRFNELFQKISEESFKDIDFPLLLEFYGDAQKEEKTVSPFESVSKFLPLLEKLQELGIGFIRIYTTTTKNTYLEFIFRTFPDGSRKEFLEFLDNLISKKIVKLNDEEKWVTYLRNYFTHDDPIVKNKTYSFSVEKIKKALKKISSGTALQFIRDDIKSSLSEKLSKRLNSSINYLPVLGYLIVLSQESQNKYLVYPNNFEQIPYNSKEEFNSNLKDLIDDGIILVDGTDYVITSEVKEVITDFERRTRLRMIAVDSYKKAERALSMIFREAEEEVKILDPYFDGIALKNTFPLMSENIRFLVLYNYESKEKIKEYAEKYKAEIKNIEIRKFEKTNKDEEKIPHDRIIIVDNEIVWQLGASINGLGKKFSTVYSHSEESLLYFIKYFDNMWGKSKKVFP